MSGIADQVQAQAPPQLNLAPLSGYSELPTAGLLDRFFDFLARLLHHSARNSKTFEFHLRRC